MHSGPMCTNEEPSLVKDNYVSSYKYEPGSGLGAIEQTDFFVLTLVGDHFVLRQGVPRHVLSREKLSLWKSVMSVVRGIDGYLWAQQFVLGQLLNQTRPASWRLLGGYLGDILGISWGYFGDIWGDIWGISWGYRYFYFQVYSVSGRTLPWAQRQRCGPVS